MIYHLLFPFKDVFFGFNVVKYITFRAAASAITAMILSVYLGPIFIRWFYSIKVGQPIRKEHCMPLYAKHKDKEGTPTMGGVLIFISILISVLLWTDLTNQYVWWVIIISTGFCVLGFIDDYLKIKHKNSRGLRARNKFFIECVFSIILAYWLFNDSSIDFTSTVLTIPFFKTIMINLGIFYFIFVIFVLTGSCNAVNLTDGLDGLSIGVMTICALAFCGVAYVSGHFGFSNYLNIPFIPLSGELTIVCAAMVGSGLGFLWFNAYPAQIFMGDTGSLALGAMMGSIALILHKEIMYSLIGGIFVIEALSVILQVGSFKLTGKRIFKMAPLHHHFEMEGWPETKITVRFWILAIIFSLIGLSTLKLQ